MTLSSAFGHSENDYLSLKISEQEMALGKRLVGESGPGNAVAALSRKATCQII